MKTLVISRGRDRFFPIVTDHRQRPVLGTVDGTKGVKEELKIGKDRRCRFTKRKKDRDRSDVHIWYRENVFTKNSFRSRY